MRVLCVPNWSFGRDRGLLRQVRDDLDARPIAVHFCESDTDHNRTVTAFSGAPGDVVAALQALADRIVPCIDLNRHVGVHPRVGALDVCPFIRLGDTPGEPSPHDPSADRTMDQTVDSFAAWFADRFEVPVFLYEKSERGRHEADLPSLRRGGFGGLLGRTLHSDYGPRSAHPRYGIAVMGERDWLIALNVDLHEETPAVAKRIAADIRRMREEGEARFLGVRALGLYLATAGVSQVSMNLTLPDRTPVDPIVEWVADQAKAAGSAVARTQLVGVIARRHLEWTTRVPVRPEQIVD
ncbi:MAG: hypothetical protein SNJ74_06560 [Fimbriimonadaceae bacterium]